MDVHHGVIYWLMMRNRRFNNMPAHANFLPGLSTKLSGCFYSFLNFFKIIILSTSIIHHGCVTVLFLQCSISVEILSFNACAGPTYLSSQTHSPSSQHYAANARGITKIIWLWEIATLSSSQQVIWVNLQQYLLSLMQSRNTSVNWCISCHGSIGGTSFCWHKC